MVITKDTPILASPSITLARAMDMLAAQEKRHPTVPSRSWALAREYVSGLWQFAPITGLDPWVAFVQAWHETAGFTSPRWMGTGNPAGLDVPMDSSTGVSFINGYAAAAVHVIALTVAVSRAPVLGTLWDGALSGEARDFLSRWLVKYRAPECPTVRVVGDLNQTYRDSDSGDLRATWAVDPAYEQGMTARSREMLALAPSTTEGTVETAHLNMEKGLIPLPPHVEQIIDPVERDHSLACRGYDDLGIRKSPPVGIVLHRPQSNPETSNEGYLRQRCCPALFDWEVLASGSAKRFNRLGDAPSGWANGVVSAPYGDALKWLEFIGWDIDTVNRDWESVEVGGWFIQPGVPSREDPITEAQWAWTAQLIASRAHDFGIPWHEFPLVSWQGDRSYLTWHQEWTIGTGKVCPGTTLMQGTSALIERARQLMKAAQTGGKPAKPPTYAKPVLPEWWERALVRRVNSDAMHDDVLWRFMRRRYEAVANANRYSEPNTKSPKSGPMVFGGKLITAERVFEDAAGKWWIVEDEGHYLPARAFSPDVRPKARG